MRTPVAMVARSGLMAAPCSAGFGGGAGAAAAEAEAGWRAPREGEGEAAAAGGGAKRGLEGREWEWEREMGLEERRRREKERAGRRERGPALAPRWWQVSGEAAVEDAMAAAAAAARGVGVEAEVVGERWGLSGWTAGMPLRARSIGRIGSEGSAWTRRWCTAAQRWASGPLMAD